MDDVCFYFYPFTLSVKKLTDLELSHSYDSFKIFMGLPTTGGPAPSKKQS